MITASEGDKNATSEETSEEVTVVLDERQKEKIASSYKTPTNPCIFVHPNTKAKSGKFDCRVESLSVLLDYRTEDNKEGTFEVSLFAELFNEMLTRDSAFKIFKALANAPEKVKEKREDRKEKEDKKDDKEKKEETIEDTGTPGEKTEKATAEESATKPVEIVGEETREASVEITKEEVEVKEQVMVTKDKDLLLGFSYFDLSHCGYIESKDVEDILLPLELDLSRAEIKKLAGKLASKDQINYRILVDGEEGVETDSSPVLDTAELAKGFKKFIPGNEDSAAQSVTENMVQYKGSVVDVAKLMDKLDKSEKVRSATDLKLIDLQEKFAVLKETNEKTDKKKDALFCETKDLKKKVRGLEDDLKKSQDESAKYFQVLSDVHDKVKPVVSPAEQTEEKGTETIPQVTNATIKILELVRSKTLAQHSPEASRIS